MGRRCRSPGGTWSSCPSCGLRRWIRTRFGWRCSLGTTGLIGPGVMGCWWRPWSGWGGGGLLCQWWLGLLLRTRSLGFGIIWGMIWIRLGLLLLWMLGWVRRCLLVGWIILRLGWFGGLWM